MFIGFSLLALAAVVPLEWVNAANLSRGTPPRVAPRPAIVTWAGIYSGTLTGYAFYKKQTIRMTGNGGVAGALADTQIAIAQGHRYRTIGIRQEGLIGFGAKIGCDHEFTPGNGLVLGGTFDALLIIQVGRAALAGPALAASALTLELSAFRQRLPSLGPVDVCVGYGFDRVLVYRTDGFAFDGVNDQPAFLGGIEGWITHRGKTDGVVTSYVYNAGVENALPLGSKPGRYNPLIHFRLAKPAALSLDVEHPRYHLGGRDVVADALLLGAPTESLPPVSRTKATSCEVASPIASGGCDE